MLTGLIGNISVEEFAKVMSQSPGKPPSKEEVERIIKEVDIDGDGSINFNGESILYANKRKERKREEVIIKKKHILSRRDECDDS